MNPKELLSCKVCAKIYTNVHKRALRLALYKGVFERYPVKDEMLRFRGGMFMAFIPVAFFLFFCILYFVIFKAFDMSALAMGGFVSLMIGALFAKKYGVFWEHVMRGIGSTTSIAIVMILFIVGMISALIKESNLSGGFVWIAEQWGLSAGMYPFFVFIAVGAIAMATGSSIGTFFTAFPIFYASGIAIGADPALLAGAILSGGILGDNLAPISDTTIISSSSQRFRKKAGVADIGGVVKHRSRYALTSAVVSAILFLVLGIMGGSSGADVGNFDSLASPESLVMLVPVAVMLFVAMKWRDIFLAVTIGVALGTVVGFAFGILTPTQIIGVVDGTPTGFLFDGVAGMLGIVALVISVFGIMGVLRGAGVMDMIIDRLVNGKLASTDRGTEIAIGIGASVTTVLLGGVNSAAMVTFGPVADELGARKGLHPYRRSNVMDCFALGIPSIVPILSAYLFIGALLTTGYEEAPALSTFELFPATIYPLVLTVVIIIAVITGWGRTYEGEGGKAVPTRELASVA